MFVWNDFVVKVPDKATALFERELRAIKGASVATSLGFVDATVVEPNRDLQLSVPRGVKIPAQAILMPLLPGTNAVDADLTRADPHIISATIIDWHCRLIDRGWYNTDCKLDNIQVLPSGEIKFLDWGSLCPADKNDPIFTYCISGYHTSPHACMSINLVVTINELFGAETPVDTVVDIPEYRVHRAAALLSLQNPARTRLARILVSPA